MQRVLGIISALVVAVAFAWAAVEKFRDRTRTAEATKGLGVPASLVTAVSTLLPFAELAAATLLAIGSLTRSAVLRNVGIGVSLLLLAVFSLLIARTLRAGRAPLCFCFGARSAKPISNDNLVRNAALGALALIALVG